MMKVKAAKCFLRISRLPVILQPSNQLFQHLRWQSLQDVFGGESLESFLSNT